MRRNSSPHFSWSTKPPSTLRLVKSSQAIPSHLLRPHGEVLHLYILQLCVRFLRRVAPGLSIPSSRNHAGSGGWNHYWAVWTYNGGIRLLSIHVHPKSVDHTYCTGDEIRIDWQGHPNLAMIFQVYPWCQNLSPWRGPQSWPSAESTEPSSHQ